ncbi:MAG TPA: ribosome-associated translation inhibitor RaiA [Methylomirabilota bacterium]|nr:ribosome-associated translation inhibitor RaiA [Methylomirabilota bacterium]
MNISIKATHLDLTDSLRSYAEDKIGNLEKYLPAASAKIELERAPHHHSGLVFRAEVNIIAGGKILRAEALSEDIYAAVDLVVPKLKEQITKFKGKRETLRRRAARKRG